MSVREEEWGKAVTAAEQLKAYFRRFNGKAEGRLIVVRNDGTCVEPQHCREWRIEVSNVAQRLAAADQREEESPCRRGRFGVRRVERRPGGWFSPHGAIRAHLEGYYRET